MELESAKAGERRLRACKMLGYKAVPVNTVGVDDAEQALMMEISENECRKEFTKTERLEYARRLAQLEKAKSEQGKRTDLAQDVVQGERNRAANAVAQALGTNRETLRQEQFIENNTDLLDPADFADWDQRIGEILRELPKSNRWKSDSPTGEVETKADAIKAAGIGNRQAYDLQAMAANPDVVQAVLDKAEAEGRIPSRKQVRFLANSGTGCE